MIRRFLAIGLASALSLTAALSGIVPGALVGSDISKVSAASESKSYEISLSYSYTKIDAKTQAKSSSNTIKVGETRKPILEAYLKTTVTDNSQSTWYVDDDLNAQKTSSKTTYTAIAPSQLKWVSNDPADVEVDANGVVTGKSNYGWARITATLYDTDGVTALASDYAYVYVNNDEEEETPEPTYVQQNVGDVWSLPTTLTDTKGVTYSGDELSYSAYSEGNYSWDTENKVQTGDVYTLNKTAKTLTFNAYGTVYFTVSGRKESTATTPASYYNASYEFTINPKVGDVIADDYGKANYKILAADAATDKYEVAYAGMIKKTKKVVVSDKAYIANQEYDVVEIADGAFKNAKITSARLPRSLRKIGASAFEGSTITSLDISDTQVKELGAKALNNTKKLIELTFNADVTTKFGKNSVGSLNKKVTVNVEASSNKVFKKAVKKIKTKNVGGKNAKKAKYVEI
ncbi:MAG: hypothetical protein E7302_06520 [Butyrivibrio sp.]|jgi:hypothetical protein|nr:hypothetical protein [Butyrivibrio sp.]